MIQKLVDIIVKQQVEKGIISKEEVDIYKYGYYLLLEIIMNIIIAIFIGFIFRDIKTVIIFLLIYIPLRTYSGGWHANRLWKCTLISNFILITAEIIVNCWIQYVSRSISLLIVTCCVVIILFMSPIDTETKRLNDIEKKIYKRKTYIIVVIQMCILTACVMFCGDKYSIIIEYAYLVQAVMLVAEKVIKKCKVKG